MGDPPSRLYERHASAGRREMSYARRIGLLAKIRNLLTGEPEDAAEKAAWLAEKARVREEKAAARGQALTNLPGWKPPRE